MAVLNCYTVHKVVIAKTEISRPKKISIMLHKNLFFLFLLALFISGCSSTPYIQSDSERSIPLGKKVDLQNSAAVKDKLHNQHENWRGVKYRMGGLGKNGIDCSGFVYRTFRSELGVHIPRTTEQQSSVGKSIGRHQLRAGDLVFFKTRFKVRHVGIYIENNRFLHASTSKGVMISSLDNVYWKDKFWKAQRP